MSDRDYCYPPDYAVLRNRLNIRAAPTLEAAERQLVAQRLLEPVPRGDFDLAHLKQLAERAGHAIDLTRIDPAAWLDASRRSNTGDHAAITRCIRQALV